MSLSSLSVGSSVHRSAVVCDFGVLLDSELSMKQHIGKDTGTGKFDRGLGQILHDQLHWLDVPDRVLFKLAATVHPCLNCRAPPYLSEHCIPVSSADMRWHLHSTNRHLLAVPRFRLNIYGRRAFSVAGPMAWNSLPAFIRYPTSSTDCFRRILKLKRTCSRVTSASSALGVLNDYAL